MSKDWLYDASNSNIFKQSYMKGFLDVSGDVYIRNGNLIATNDISLNGDISCNDISLSVPFTITGINADISNALALKQDTLIAGTGITIDGTTINGQSAGSGVSSITNRIEAEPSHISINPLSTNGSWTGTAGAPVFYGFSLDSSDDGKTVVISEPQNTGINANGWGAVYIYTFNGTSWTPKGNVLTNSNLQNDYGNANRYEQYGADVAMNGNGNIIAISAPKTINLPQTFMGVIEVLEWSGTSWNRKGSIIKNEVPGQAGYSLDGFSIDINTAGDRIVVHFMDKESVSWSGGSAFIVYDYNSSTNTWDQIGNVVSVSITDVDVRHNKNIIAISGNGSRIIHGKMLDKTVDIYEYNSGTNNWDSIGSLTTGTGNFGSSVDISKDGNVIIIGANSEDGNKGAAYVYTYAGINTWNLKGSIIYGDVAGDNLGVACAINEDGTSIIIGCGLAAASNVNSSYIKHLTYNSATSEWVLTDKRYGDGVATGYDKYGGAVSMSNNGKQYFASASYGYLQNNGGIQGSFADNGYIHHISLDDVLYMDLVGNLNITGNLTINGNLSADGVVLHTSDDRLKDNEKRIENALETLDKLKPKKYKINGNVETGFIAQDIWYGAPELRHNIKTYKENIVDISGDFTYDMDVTELGWSVKPAQLNYIGLIGHITKGIQELNTLIESNKTKINVLN